MTKRYTIKQTHTGYELVDTSRLADEEVVCTTKKVWNAGKLRDALNLLENLRHISYRPTKKELLDVLNKHGL